MMSSWTPCHDPVMSNVSRAMPLSRLAHAPSPLRGGPPRGLRRRSPAPPLPRAGGSGVAAGEAIYDVEPAPSSDPYDLRRFTEKHRRHFEEALAEINRGHKTSCWSWYVLPTPPFVVDGRELGSATNRLYALKTDEEARAFLRFEEG